MDSKKIFTNHRLIFIGFAAGRTKYFIDYFIHCVIENRTVSNT